MGWHISETENTVELTDACIDELFEKQDTFYGINWDDREEVFWNCNGKKRLYFNEDHMEHMDFVCKEVVKIIKKHKLEGDICFESVEGDNAGSKWGYRFDGKGGFKDLRAKVIWEEV